jgi:hypothetical protein
MDVTFQHKIILRPGSVFRFGTIYPWQTRRELYIALRTRWRENLPRQSPEKSEQSRKKRNLQRSEQRLPPASQEQRIILLGELRCPPPLWKNGCGSQGKRKQMR